MCNPLAYAGLQAGAGVANFVQGTINAQATNSYQKRLSAHNTQLATESAFRAYRQLQKRGLQEAQAAAQSIDEVSQQAVRAQGLAKVAGGEAGVGGRGVDKIIDDFRRQALQAQSVSIQNRNFTQDALNQETEAVRLQLQSQLVNLQPQQVAEPNPFNALLQIGTAVTGTLYQNYFNPATGKLELFGASSAPTAVDSPSNPSLLNSVLF